MWYFFRIRVSFVGFIIRSTYHIYVLMLTTFFKPRISSFDGGIIVSDCLKTRWRRQWLCSRWLVSKENCNETQLDWTGHCLAKRCFLLEPVTCNLSWGATFQHASATSIMSLFNFVFYLSKHSCWVSFKHNLIWTFAGPVLTVCVVRLDFINCIQLL